MLNAPPHNHKLFFYVHFAFACALMLATFLLVPETAYKRKMMIPPPNSVTNVERLPEKHTNVVTHSVNTSHSNTASVELSGPAVVPAPHTYLSTLKPWNGVDHEVSFFGMILRSFSYFLVPQVLWVIVSFGQPSGPATLVNRSANSSMQVFISAAQP